MSKMACAALCVLLSCGPCGGLGYSMRFVLFLLWPFWKGSRVDRCVGNSLLDLCILVLFCFFSMTYPLQFC